MEKTHWKNNFNYDYLGAYSLKPNEEVILTITSIKKEIVKGANGDNQECTIAYFKEKVNNESKPMILNKTNCKTITKVYKTPYIEEWIGQRIKIYVEDNIKAFGDVVSALRVSPVAPPLPELVLDSDNYKKVVEYLATKGASILKVKTKYLVSKELEEKLLSV